ncbi:NAD(P)-dependent oxidoreductase [Faecalibacillus intestinalis]
MSVSGSAIEYMNDLIEVLNQGHLYGVGLDVVEEEPLPAYLTFMEL